MPDVVIDDARGGDALWWAVAWGDRIPELAWSLVALVSALLIVLVNGWQTVPFHVAWVSFGVLYGYRRWRIRTMLVLLIGVATVTGSALLMAKIAPGEHARELSEVPLMSLLVLAMSWHVERRRAAVSQVERLELCVEAAEIERRRWAHELHDQTLQGLTGLKLTLASALHGAPSEQTGVCLADALGDIDDEIENLYAVIWDLRPPALESQGLAAALECLVDRIAGGRDIDVRVTVDLDDEDRRASLRLPPEIETAIYRVVQEALTNAVKHAHSRQVAVRVVERDATVEVRVSDDGVGCRAHIPPRSYGLIGMRERIELAGGRLSVRSAPGQGTTIGAVLPADHTSSRHPPALVLDRG